MLSQGPVFSRLSDHFVALRLDWEQGNHFKDRFGFVPGTGDQLILSPDGSPVTHESVRAVPVGSAGRDGDPKAHGQSRSIIFGRHGIDTTPEVLDAVITRHPKRSDALRVEWFWWGSSPSRRPGGRYPPPVDAAAAIVRLPVAEICGPLPAAFRGELFLRRHVRQFIWVRGRPHAEPRVTIRRVRDGLPSGQPVVLADLDPNALSGEALGRELDRAWLEFMKARPRVARGYLDNQHGRWMRTQAGQMVTEDDETRRRAAQGTLRPPGR